MTLPTAEEVRHLFDYDPETGILTWRNPRSTRVRAGSRAGSRNSFHVHREVKIDGRLYKEHRVIWLYVHGSWPEHTIDHINGVRDDNRLVNLRDIPMEGQAQNRPRASPHSATGVRGVYPKGNRFRAAVTTGGKGVYLGTFDTVEEARAAYLAAKVVLHKYHVVPTDS